MTTFDNVYGVPVYWTYTPGRKPAYCTFFLDADKVIEISISVEKWGILVGGQRNSTLRITNTSGDPMIRPSKKFVLSKERTTFPMD